MVNSGRDENYVNRVSVPCGMSVAGQLQYVRKIGSHDDAPGQFNQIRDNIIR